MILAIFIKYSIEKYTLHKLYNESNLNVHLPRYHGGVKVVYI
jgi:hypothetical protein